MSEKTDTPEISKVPPIKKKKKKKKRLMGFAAIIAGQLKPLNNSDYFKEKYGEDNFDILLIATDDRRAALVHIKDGTVEIEQVKNTPEEIKPVKKKIKTRITTDIETFLKFAMGKVDPIKAVLKRKLKIKGIRKILQFVKYFKVLSYIEKQRKIQSETKPE
jgi:putative sterol carrier protein